MILEFQLLLVSTRTPNKPAMSGYPGSQPLLQEEEVSRKNVSDAET